MVPFDVILAAFEAAFRTIAEFAQWGFLVYFAFKIDKLERRLAARE